MERHYVTVTLCIEYTCMYDGGESGGGEPCVEDEADEHGEREQRGGGRVRVGERRHVAAARPAALPRQRELHDEPVERDDQRLAEQQPDHAQAGAAVIASNQLRRLRDATPAHCPTNIDVCCPRPTSAANSPAAASAGQTDGHSTVL